MLVTLVDEVLPPSSATLEILAVDVVVPNIPTEVRSEGFTFNPVMLWPKPWKVPLNPVESLPIGMKPALPQEVRGSAVAVAMMSLPSA